MLSKCCLRLAAAILVAFSLAHATQVFAQYHIVNIIPRADSAERSQNSEMDLGVNPNNPKQVIIGAFDFSNFNNPYFQTQDGGTTWTRFQNITHLDESVAYSASGIAYAAPLNPVTAFTVYKSTDPAAPHFQQIPGSTFRGSSITDQPWIKAAQVDGQDHIYVGVNDLSHSPNGNTATLHYSTNGGTSWRNEIIERQNPHGYPQDGPPVRVAINGNTVYAAFEHWTGTAGGGFRSDVRVVKDVNGGDGATPFRALGNAGNGFSSTAAASIIDPFDMGTTRLGQQRLGSNLNMAVDPNNPNKVVVGYINLINNSPRLEIQMSTDGGATWAKVDNRVRSSGTGGGEERDDRVSLHRFCRRQAADPPGSDE